MEWQPIETAPKDGTEILVWAGSCVVVSWRRLNGIGYPREAWRLVHGAYSSGDEGDWSNEVEHPTHWMPLPAPPLP